MTDRKTLSDAAHLARTTSAGWMIQRLSAVLNEGMKAELASQGLTLDQFILLMTLAEADGVTQTDLGGRVRLANYTVTRALDALAARGLVERRPDAASRRAHRVLLTAAGQALMPVLFDIVEERNARLLEPMSEQERRQFLLLLSRLVDGAQVKSAS